MTPTTHSGVGHVTRVSKYTWRQRCGACGMVSRLQRYRGGISQCGVCAGYFSREALTWAECRTLWVLSDCSATASALHRNLRKPLFFSHRQLREEKP